MDFSEEEKREYKKKLKDDNHKYMRKYVSEQIKKSLEFLGIYSDEYYQERLRDEGLLEE
jgi:arginyl-tRNA synthetase